MKIVKRKDEIAKEVEENLKKTDGYCPCAIERSPNTKCMCRDFKINCNDPTWFGTCHCGLYEKVKDNET